MQIDYLKCFVALSEFKSINKTSQFLSTTSQNVGRILKKMETELGTVLFIRTQAGIRLTPHGEEFLAFAQTMVAQYDELQAKFQYHNSEQHHVEEVMLYSSDAINETVLNEILLDFSKHYPSIIVKNINVDWREGYKKISCNPEALAFLYYFPDENNLEAFTILPALRLHPVVIVNKNHPLARGKSCHLDQLYDYRLLVFTKSNLSDTLPFYSLQLDNECAHHSIACSGNVNTCYQMALTGDYVFFDALENFSKQEKTVREQLTPLAIVDQREIACALIKAKDVSTSSVQNLLYAFILRYLQQVDKN